MANEKYECECLDCGHRLTSEKHCKDIKCPKCAGEMRRAERPGPGQRTEAKGELQDETTLRPLPNEHTCHLAQSTDFQKGEGGNETREHDGKKYRVIFGIPKGKRGSVERSYRYPKDTWTAKQARAHCEEHGGTFEAAKETATKSISTSFDFSGSISDFKDPLQEGITELAQQYLEVITGAPLTETLAKTFDIYANLNVTILFSPEEAPALAKAVASKRLRQGTVLKVKPEKQQVFAIAYKANDPDFYGDWMDEETLERMAHRYLAKLSHGDLEWSAIHPHTGMFIGGKQRVGDAHEDWTVSMELIESFVAPAGITLYGHHIEMPSWIIGLHILDKELWEKIVSGERDGVSLVVRFTTEEE